MRVTRGRGIADIVAACDLLVEFAAAKTFTD